MANTIISRNEVPAEETWAVEDIYASEQDWEAAFKKLQESLSGYETYKGHLGESPAMLYGCLKFDEKLGKQLDLLYSYAHLNADVDTQNAKYQEMVGRAASLWAAAGAASSFMNAEILAIPEDKLKAFEASPEADPAFDRSLEVILRERAHTRSKEVEQVLADAAEVTSGPSSIFRMFNNADTRFPLIRSEDGEMTELTHGRYVTFLESSDRAVRKEAFEAMYGVFGKHKNTLAAMFQANTKQAWFYAKTRQYESSRAYYLSDANIPESVYDTLIETVHESMPLMYRYVALRRKVLGVSELHMYDLYTPLAKAPERKIPYETAMDMVEEALLPMGEEYMQPLRRGLKGRWVDFRENQGKRSGAYSAGPYGVHPYVLMSYQGNLDNVFTLAHEMGHAMHTYFSNENQTFTNAQYKIFVAEVASTCNENILNRALLKKAQSKEERAYILNHFLDGFKGTVFRQTMFAEFEKIVHEKTAAGEVLTAEGLCSIYKELNELYFGDGIVVDEEIAMEWARIPHFYTPFYVYQYATGFAAATCLSERILREGKPAVADYMGFLKGGCSKDAIELLADAGVDMRTAEPIRIAMKAFETALEELEALLAE